jgi:hypothetical protein
MKITGFSGIAFMVFLFACGIIAGMAIQISKHKEGLPKAEYKGEVVSFDSAGMTTDSLFSAMNSWDTTARWLTLRSYQRWPNMDSAIKAAGLDKSKLPDGAFIAVDMEGKARIVNPKDSIIQ